MSIFKFFRGKSENLPSSLSDGYVYLSTDDGKIYIDATIDGTVKRILINSGDTLMNTTAYWNAQSNLVSKKGCMYVYTDYKVSSSSTKSATVYIPGIKIGDGKAYVTDLPFVDELLIEHIADTNMHVTNTDKLRWNYAWYGDVDSQTLSFYQVTNYNPK